MPQGDARQRPRTDSMSGGSWGECSSAQHFVAGFCSSLKLLEDSLIVGLELGKLEHVADDDHSGT